MLALGILTFVALVLIGLFLALLKTSAKNREQAMAELLTESLLEKATAAGPPGWGVDQRIDERLEVTLQQDGSRFFYQVEPRLITPEPSQPDGHCYKVTVTVGWWTEGDLQQSRQGFGNQYVKGVRTVYLRDGDRV